MSLETRIAALSDKKQSQWAWANYLPTVREVIAEQHSRDIIEIGGGRAPALTRSEIAALGIEYTCSDIMASELARAPEWVKTAHFDVQTADKSQRSEEHTSELQSIIRTTSAVFCLKKKHN